MRTKGLRSSLLLSLAVALSYATAGQAQRISDSIPDLTGVVQTADGQPVTNATVGLLGLGAAVTDSAGMFGFRGVPPGTFLLRAQRLGVKPVVQVVTLDGVHPQRVTLRFAESSVLLAPIIIRDSAPRSRQPGGFELRRQAGQGLYFTEQDIARRHSLRVEYLLATLPGLSVDSAGVVRLDRGRTSLYGDNCQDGVQILIDGVAVANDYSLRNLSVNSLRGIEVYRGVASTPAELRSPRMACGTVAIWTK